MTKSIRTTLFVITSLATTVPIAYADTPQTAQHHLRCSKIYDASQFMFADDGKHFTLTARTGFFSAYDKNAFNNIDVINQIQLQGNSNSCEWSQQNKMLFRCRLQTKTQLQLQGMRSSNKNSDDRALQNVRESYQFARIILQTRQVNVTDVSGFESQQIHLSLELISDINDSRSWQRINIVTDAGLCSEPEQH